MRTSSLLFLTLSSALCSSSQAAEEVSFTNFIRQVQMPTGVQRDISVTPTGEQQSPLEINPGGARFELWTVRGSSTPQSFLLDAKYVGAYVPIAQVKIRSADPYPLILRTRADQPFYVDITTTGLLSGATDPEASKSVKLLRHVQSYGAGGTGINTDRSQATLLSQASVTSNGIQTLTYSLTSIPGSDRSKVRGEERFSVFSLADYQAPESQLASQFIQIWPVADGKIAGIQQGQMIRNTMPPITFTVKDIYPGSAVQAQVYKGNPQLGKVGTIVPGSARNYSSETVPQDALFPVQNYDAIIDAEGRWTMELLAITPFGIDRLDYVSFDIDRTIEVNSSVITGD